MTLQIDGTLSLQKQQTQLQALETFFVEVIDYQAGESEKNDITTKDSSGTATGRLQLAVISTSDDLVQISAKASTIVFDRVNFVESRKQRVVGFRTSR